MNAIVGVVSRVKAKCGRKPGCRFSDETRARMRAAHLGKKASPEHRAAMSAAMRGKRRAPETRAKLSGIFSDPELIKRRLASRAKTDALNGDLLKPEQVAAILADYRKRDAYAVAEDWLISPQHVWKLAQRHGVRKRA